MDISDSAHGGNAARADGRCDLPDGVGEDIACGIETWDGRGPRFGINDDTAIGCERQEVSKRAHGGRIAEQDKDAIDGPFERFRRVAQAHGTDASLIVSGEDFQRERIIEPFDCRRLPGAMQSGGQGRLIGRDDGDQNEAADTGEVESAGNAVRLRSGDENGFILEESAIACGACRDASPEEFVLAGDSEPCRFGPCSEKDATGLERFSEIGCAKELAIGLLPERCERFAHAENGPEAERLCAHGGGQFRAFNSLREAWIILQFFDFLQSPARQPFQNDGLYAGASGVQGGGQSGGTSSGNQKINHGVPFR